MSSRAQAEIRRIMAALTNAIVEHRLPPGARLTESKLVEALGANRNHVRAALQKLSAESKVVDLIPNRGAFVAMPSAEEARQVFSARLVLERAIVDLVINNLNAVNRGRLKKQIEREREAIASHDRQQMIRESGNFHRVLGQVSGNRVLAELNETLIVRSSLIIALYQETPTVRCSLGEHESVMQALLAEDCDTALRLMAAHMEDIQKHLLLDRKDHRVDLKAALAERGQAPGEGSQPISNRCGSSVQ